MTTICEGVFVPLMYPDGLPAPSQWDVMPRERRGRSDLQGRPGTRSRWSDRVGDVAAAWVYTAAQMAVWRPWFDNMLGRGLCWFAAHLPGPGGWTQRVVRYRTRSLRIERLAMGPNGPLFKVSAAMELRERSDTPTAPKRCPDPEDVVLALPDPREPTLFGSGVYMARDPVTGYVWTTWRNGWGINTPIGGSGTYDGAFVLIYDPLSMTLVEALPIGPDGVDFMCIIYRDGFFYVGVEGNSYNDDIGIAPVVTKISACCHDMGQGNTSYMGAVSKLGLISQDDSGLYMSVVNGLGAGTAPMGDQAPFGTGQYTGNSDWLFNAVYNPVSDVRAYTGYGAFVDLRGAVTMSIGTLAYINSTHMQSTRMLVKAGTEWVFVMNVGSAGVIALNTLTGDVQQVIPKEDGRLPLAMYYSPETNRLYIELWSSLGVPSTTWAFDGDTFEVLAEYPLDTIHAEGQQLGNSIYLGNETFVACESTSAPSARMWRVSFGWR